mmetsp:Transcript_27822/g.59386  ORF Transcript_27822/g.59386 Transcript_27822/m.59386 type:complete len:143 (-) Transcript_27822:258-686(-)
MEPSSGSSSHSGKTDKSGGGKTDKSGGGSGSSGSGKIDKSGSGSAGSSSSSSTRSNSSGTAGNNVYCLNDNGDSGIYNSDQECSDANCSTEEGRCPVYNVCWTENPSKSPTTNSPTGRRSRPQTPCAITTLDPTFLLRFGNK